MNIAISRKINFLPTETPSRVVCALVAVLLTWVTCLSASMADKSPDSLFVVQVNAAEADVLKAVQGVSEDQIVHGTFSYEKERTLYGAHASNSAPAFGRWNQPGKVVYKVASGVLAPRFFKDSGDIGTISVRYVVQAVDASTTNLRIDALFVDARNVKHASKGSVEAAEYGAIQERMRSMQADRKDTARAEQEIAAERAQTPGKLEHAKHGVSGSDDSWALGLDVPQLEQRVAELRHDAELEVKDPGGSLKAAPFRAAATLASLPGKTEVVVVVLTPFWYGVQTEDGHRGWIHRSEVEPLE